MKNLFKTAAAAVALSLAAATLGFAEDEVNVSTGITTAGAPLAVHGVDTVALATRNAVVEGKGAHTVVHEGAAYYFASADAARAFKADPDKYLPQYGGFCTFAVALGKKFDGDPRYADIVGGKLYLFVNAEIYEKYKKDANRIRRNADKKWPSIRDVAVADL